MFSCLACCMEDQRLRGQMFTMFLASPKTRCLSTFLKWTVSRDLFPNMLFSLVKLGLVDMLV